MRKILLIIFIGLLKLSVVKSQNFFFTLTGAMSNYQGDLQGSMISLKNIRGAFGAGIYYQVKEKLYLRSQVVFAKVAGNDAGTVNQARNLSFSSPVTEIHLGAEYDIFNVYERGSTPYVFAGIAYVKFNPSAIDSLGNKVYLQPLGTEGQGFYQGRKKYSLNGISIPFGAGLKQALNDNIMLRIELIMRKTFTDYLDDVSTFYIDRTALLTNNGAKAVEMAFRGDEYKNTFTYPREGTIRGNPKSKDYYYTIGASISFRLGAAEDRLMKKYKTRLGCPTNVF